jgi:hypothetical protein
MILSSDLEKHFTLYHIDNFHISWSHILFASLLDGKLQLPYSKLLA